VKRLRLVTFAVVLAWGAAAVSTILRGFPGTPTVQAIFAVAAIYVIAISVSARAEGDRHFDPVK
jgi:phosphatidylcholine synthase